MLIQPPVFDRLTNEPGPDWNRESEAIEALRRAVMRDLHALLNTSCLATAQDLSRYPEVETSVVNFGIPGFAGSTASTLTPTALKAALEAAIVRYEPRLDASSVEVTVDTRKKAESEALATVHNVLSLTIRAELRADPRRIELVLRTAIDFENGSVSPLQDAPAGAKR